MRVGIYEGNKGNEELRGSWLGGDDYLKGKKITHSHGLIVKPAEVVISYSQKRIASKINSNIQYTVLGDQIEDEVLGIFAGIKTDKGLKNVAFFKKGGKPTRIALMLADELGEEIDYKSVAKELEELVNKPYSEIEGEPYPLAGAFVGESKGELVVIPFSVYKAKSVIPAFLEEGEEIAKLEAEIEAINKQISETEDEKEIERLKEQRRNMLAKLSKTRAKLYRPDLLKAIVQKMVNGEEAVFLSKKTEIRAMGENLLEGAKVFNDINGDRAVFVFISFPAVNNISNELMRQSLPLCVAVGNEFGLEPLDTYKAKDYLRKLANGIREILESVEAGANVPTFGEEKNLSLKKRLTDIAKFVVANPEAVEEVKKGLEELEKGLRLLYSPFSIKDLYTRTDAIRDLTERGIDIKTFTAEDWKLLNEILNEVNLQLENALRETDYSRIFEIFHRLIQKRAGIKIKVKEGGELKEVVYPNENPTIWDYTPSERFVGIIKLAVKKLGLEDKLKEIQVGYIFGETEINLTEPQIYKALARLILKDLAKLVVEEQKTLISPSALKEDIEELKRKWKGEWVAKKSQIEDIELEDYLLDTTESAINKKEEDLEDLNLEDLEF
jgi:hypothetical protein